MRMIADTTQPKEETTMPEKSEDDKHEPTKPQEITPEGHGDKENASERTKAPVKDPDEPEPKVFEMKLTVYFYNNGLDDDEFMDYIEYFTEEANEFWSNRTYTDKDGTKTVIKPRFTYSIISSKKEATAAGNHIVFNVQANGISHVQGDKGLLNIKDKGNTAGHEIGHYFGLKDRYHEYREQTDMFRPDLKGEKIKNNLAIDQTDASRKTIPMALRSNHPDFKDYDPHNNAYSGGSNTLTNWQLGVVVGAHKEKQEKQLLISGVTGESNKRDLGSYYDYEENKIAIQSVNNRRFLRPRMLLPNRKEVSSDVFNPHSFHWSTLKWGFYRHSKTQPFNAQSKKVRKHNRKATRKALH